SIAISGKIALTAWMITSSKSKKKIKIRKIIMSENTISKDAIVIERVFDAPVELIWELWTKAEHFQYWYGPEGLSIPVAQMDVQVGGKRLICMEMSSPHGDMKMWTTGEYQEVVQNKRLVYTDSPADENGEL